MLWVLIRNASQDALYEYLQYVFEEKIRENYFLDLLLPAAMLERQKVQILNKPFQVDFDLV